MLFKWFYNSFGIFVRAIQKSLSQANAQSDFVYLMHQQALKETVEFVSNNLGKAVMFSSREKLWDYCIEKILKLRAEPDLTVLEFGVYKGQSINVIARKLPKSRIYGFDSFEGLEEDWSGYLMIKGAFSTDGSVPKCRSNVELVKGWYTDTLPKFLEKSTASQVHLLHMDSDTFTPTIYVLKSLLVMLKKGSIVIFDEYFGYQGWKQHEYKAWEEIVSTNNIRYRYIGYTNVQVAIEIL